MFRILLFIVPILICQVQTSPAVGQDLPVLPRVDMNNLIAGERAPVLFSGSGQIEGSSNSLTTAWMQIGYSPNATDNANRNISVFNPEYFTAFLKLSMWGQGDSAGISNAHFECVFDTTSQAVWNGDSSNIFIFDGAFNLHDYGKWRFEPVSDTARCWAYPLRLLIGGYVRLVFESELADTCTVNWSLICEH